MFHGEICVFCMCDVPGEYPDCRDDRAGFGSCAAGKWFAAATAKAAG
jgi:hypothetical protein